MKIDGNTFTLSKDEARVFADCASSQKSSTVIRAVRFSPFDGVVIATNGHVALLCRAARASDGAFKLPAPVVPADSVRRAVKLAGKGDEVRVVVAPDGQASLVVGSIGFPAEHHPWEYPDVESVVPDETDTQSPEVVHLAARYLSLLGSVCAAGGASEPSVRVQCCGEGAPVRFDHEAPDGSLWTLVVMPCR